MCSAPGVSGRVGRSQILKSSYYRDLKQTNKCSKVSAICVLYLEELGGIREFFEKKFSNVLHSDFEKYVYCTDLRVLFLCVRWR